MFRIYEEVESAVSTNTSLKEEVRSSKAPLCKILRARSQTGGRGRQGNAFFSPSGGIYFSFTLPLKGSEPALRTLTLLAGNETRRSLQALTAEPVLLKWPNDLYLGGKKLGGILTELVSSPWGLCAVIGIGVNDRLQTKDVPEELREKLTSLSLHGVPSPNAERLIKEIAAATDAAFAAANADKSAKSALLKEMEARSFLTGKTVSRMQNGEVLTGRVLGLDENGGLILQTAHGTVTVTSGVVEET